MVLLFCLTLVPVGAAVGAVAGASAADSVDDIEAATSGLRSALLAADPASGVREATATDLRDRGIVVEQPSEADRAAHVLELSVNSFDLLVVGQIDAEATIVLNVQTSLRDRDGVARSPPLSYGFVAAPVDYLDLARDDAHLLKRMIEQAYARTAELIADGLCAEQDAEPRAARPACIQPVATSYAPTPPSRSGHAG